jgi:putative Ca2+/H+ antiporter (TMEM165/GDT1 family)
MATEIGDKTFFIAAVLSMRNDRAAVFGDAILTLILMTVLSTLMGLVLPALMPRKYTHLIGGALFLYFGFKLLNDSRMMKDGVSEELEEVEEELAEMSKKKNRVRKKRQVKEKKGMDPDDEDCAADDNGPPDDIKGGGGGGGRWRTAAIVTTLPRSAGGAAEVPDRRGFPRAA